MKIEWEELEAGTGLAYRLLLGTEDEGPAAVVRIDRDLVGDQRHWTVHLRDGTGRHGTGVAGSSEEAKVLVEALLRAWGLIEEESDGGA